jgi:hypothetical protein
VAICRTEVTRNVCDADGEVPLVRDVAPLPVVAPLDPAPAPVADPPAVAVPVPVPPPAEDPLVRD